ncbi:nucleoporin Nup43 [Chrysoperla carnea]|uniref:nucleoporin Nup43 n=1 Tax=Chrysoperla carnea TaxID=189513 RepID=UPI001D05FFB1|nr:nucleoporin Nup43 [Chrysoperla carnea]
MGENVHGTFISEKPSKIRWKPEELFETQTFLTGSWDNEINNIKLWTYKVSQEDPDIYPFVLKTLPFKGDVTEIKFINSNTAVVSSSDGYAILIRVKNDQHGGFELEEISRFSNLHYFNKFESSPCTGLSVYDEDIVTVGEDGRINLLNARQSRPIQVIENADSCTLKCVCFLKHNEVLTGNMRGQMKIWDIRATQSTNTPTSTFILSDEYHGATCVTYHPTQRHVVLTGSEDGLISVWDLRQNMYPVTTLNAHTQAVAEIQFHPSHPNKLFSCSMGSELWAWNSNSKYITNNMLNMTQISDENIWLNADLSKDKLEILSLMPNLNLPMNSLDVNRDKVLCGCDNEAIYVINNIEY